MPARRASSNAGSVCSMLRILAEFRPTQSLIFAQSVHRRRPRLSIRPHPSPAGFYAGAVLLRLDHPCFLAPALLAVTTSILSLFILPGCCRGSLYLLRLCAKLTPGQLPVDGLRTLPLATHFNARRTVTEPDTGGCLLELLPPSTRTENKPLLHIRTSHPECSQPAFEFLVHSCSICSGNPAMALLLSGETNATNGSQTGVHDHSNLVVFRVE